MRGLRQFRCRNKYYQRYKYLDILVALVSGLPCCLKSSNNTLIGARLIAFPFIHLINGLRLGEKPLGMLPYPQTDFPLVAPEKREMLESLLGGATFTDQDIEAARERASKSKHRSKNIRNDIRDLDEDAGFNEIEDQLNDAIKVTPKRQEVTGEQFRALTRRLSLKTTSLRRIRV